VLGYKCTIVDRSALLYICGTIHARPFSGAKFRFFLVVSTQEDRRMFSSVAQKKSRVDHTGPACQLVTKRPNEQFDVKFFVAVNTKICFCLCALTGPLS